MILTDEIKNFQKRLDALHHHLRIEDKINFLDQEELKTQKIDFWNDSKSAELVMKRIKKSKYGLMDIIKPNLLSKIYKLFMSFFQIMNYPKQN